MKKGKKKKLKDISPMYKNAKVFEENPINESIGRFNFIKKFAKSLKNK